MFEIGRSYVFFTCDHVDDGVGSQGGVVVAIDGPLIKVERIAGVFDIINTHAPQFVRAELLKRDLRDDGIPDDLIAQPTP